MEIYAIQEIQNPAVSETQWKLAEKRKKLTARKL